MIDSAPNVDFFTKEELKDVIKKFKDDINANLISDTISSRNSILDQSTAKLFDEVMNRKRSSSFVKRRNTKLAEETVLNRNNGSHCIVSQVNQYFTSKAAGMYKDQS